jgi:hypothetical protein
MKKSGEPIFSGLLHECEKKRMQVVWDMGYSGTMSLIFYG